MDRRTSLKWMLAAASTLPVLQLVGCGTEPPPPAPKPQAGVGYGTDPNLTRVYAPGELWPLTLTVAQRRTATALSDLILPEDADGPGAVAVGVVDFIDEWISAPYEQQRKDRTLILDGFTWLDVEAQRRGGQAFAALGAPQQTAICDDICYLPRARSAFRQAATFFARYRDLTAGGFCTSPQGWQYLRYVGNRPLTHFDGPPREVLQRVGVA